MRMIMLPNATLNTAIHGDNPRATREEAIVKEGIHTDIPTHSIAIWYVDQDLAEIGVGARVFIVVLG